MILGRKKAILKTANDLYESMTKYSRVKSNFYKTLRIRFDEWRNIYV